MNVVDSHHGRYPIEVLGDDEDHHPLAAFATVERAEAFVAWVHERRCAAPGVTCERTADWEREDGAALCQVHAEQAATAGRPATIAEPWRST